ncbi:hypothetical protein HG263_04670 [Pseudoalteromonas sp. JBTF-M23]|uniref:PRTase-CE domain-containing protein n=1 Tax=Pseudoalteromonas caenipelagi TaxID=2726988 RepID=A0A849VDK9_9GAMM|nr:phosphoribosyltransferase [Pseudoalteromonas caenipelagi]NOU49827.1 hypothetical protein [Pseudoalteromonas caenipelagi]
MEIFQPKSKSKEDFYNIEKYKKQTSWLDDECYENGLQTLLNEFPDKDERELLFELINKVVHQRISDRIQTISTLVKKIEDLKISPNNTLIIATAKKGESDGSQAWLYFFKFYLAQHNGWKERQLKSTICSGVEHMKSDRRITDVVIFDDFIGTGSTMINKVKEFVQNLKKEGIKIPKIHIFSLAGMSFGVDKVQSKIKINVECPVLIKKGITEQLTCQVQINKQKSLMRSMEKKLEKKYNHKPFTGKYSLGYEGSEALFQVQFSNCANNVFPIFWMKPKGNQRFRNTLFHRL